MVHPFFRQEKSGVGPDIAAADDSDHEHLLVNVMVDAVNVS
jgi:hypothetical protein